LINNGEEVFEGEAFNVSAHFVQIFQVFVAAFVEFSALSFELFNNLFVATEVSASVGVSDQIQSSGQMVEFVSEVSDQANFTFQFFFVFSSGVLGESVNQIL